MSIQSRLRERERLGRNKPQPVGAPTVVTMKQPVGVVGGRQNPRALMLAAAMAAIMSGGRQ